ncbi:MAG: peptidoglycan DD-metalloendopeptidase family protein, partial [Anaerolineales bacterium]
RYGETKDGALRPHHGVEFFNPTGTPIIAAAGGEVTYAGPDWDVIFGPNAYFYGNMVAIKLDRAYLHQPVYTLYGHMNSIDVETGQRVEAGQQLGTVGGTGVALGGAHLHFEVRVGQNHYDATRNPELWLRPFPRWGALAGRVTDPDGNLVAQANVAIRSVTITAEDFEGSVSRFVATYAFETLNPDEQLGENFALIDLPPGTYQVSVATGRSSKKQTVTVERDRLAWVEFTDVLPRPEVSP